MKKALCIILFSAGIMACSRQSLEKKTSRSDWFKDTNNGRYDNEQEFCAYWASSKDTAILSEIPNLYKGWNVQDAK